MTPAPEIETVLAERFAAMTGSQRALRRFYGMDLALAASPKLETP